MRRLPAILRMVLGQDVVTPEDRETAFYLRITLIVCVAMIAGIVLHRRVDITTAWIAYGVAYVAGGWPIALDSWAELKNRRLSIDFLMGAAAVGAALVGSPLEGVVLIFLFSLSKALEAYAMGRTRHAIARLMDLTPEEATLADEEGRAAGSIRVDRIQEMEFDGLTPALARRSGFASVVGLLKVAKHGPGVNVYLVRFHYVPPDRPKAKRSAS